MKKAIITILLMVIGAMPVRAQLNQRDFPLFEIGVVLGEPTGLSGKMWLDNRSAAQAAVAWSFSDEGRFELQGSYLFHFLEIVLEQGDLPVYFGLGAALRINGDSFVGARVPIGIEYILPNGVLSVFVEGAPVTELIPDVNVEASGGVGLRFVF
jgi:hypothetical protein